MVNHYRLATFGFFTACLATIATPMVADEPPVDGANGVFTQIPDEEPETTPDPAKDDIGDYRIKLESGLTMDMGEIFRPEIEQFRESLCKRVKKSNPPMLRYFHDETKKPMLLAERRGKVLNGLFATFAEDGAPIAHTSYKKGDRTSTLLTWDEAHRPLVFEQYADGKLHGVRCLFRGCCDACTDGHVWLVQEWKNGVLDVAHLVLDDDRTKTFVYRGERNREPYGGSTPELEAAMMEIQKFEVRLARDEKKLKLLVAQSYAYEQQAAAERMKLENLRRSYQMANAIQSSRFPSVPTGGGMAVG